MKLEVVSCGLCGSADGDVLFEAENSRLRVTAEKFTLRRCRHCDLVYTSPRPVAEEMPAFYPGEYYRPTATLRGHLNRYFDRERVERARRLKPSGRILDVGCGAGGFLAEMARRGFEIQGVEPSDSVADTLPEAVRGRVHFGALETADFGSRSFDLITLWHVLEHLPSPLETLEKIRDLLKPDGILLAEVPNFGSLEARWLGPYWFALDVPRHFWHFTPATLETIAVRAGFRGCSVEASAWGHPSLLFTYWLSCSTSICQWSQAHLGSIGRWKLPAFFLKALSIPTCLSLRVASLNSLPTMRLIACR